MPTYEYLCKNCGERFEKVQSFRARPLKTHDACGGDVQKVFHPSGVVFKGPGFYATDNRGSKPTDSGSSTSNGSNGSNGSNRSNDSAGSKGTSADPKPASDSKTKKPAVSETTSTKSATSD